MAYIDYSSQFVLDMFFTFLQANQLGTNDEHLYDSLAVEHNINTATIDGTHKANSITGSMINTTPISTGSQGIQNGQTWTPTVGIYQILGQGASDYGVNLELYISGSWRTVSTGGSNEISGIIFCDGTNMRINNKSSATSVTIWYQKF